MIISKEWKLVKTNISLYGLSMTDPRVRKIAWTMYKSFLIMKSVEQYNKGIKRLYH